MLKKMLGLFILLIFITTSGYCFSVIPYPVANPDIAEEISYKDIVTAIEANKDIKDKLTSIRVKFETYYLYPTKVINIYCKLTPDIPLIWYSDSLKDKLDQDYIADWKKSILKIHLPGCAIFSVTGNINKISLIGDQKLIGILTKERDIYWIYGDPYWYLELNDLYVD